MTDEVLAVVVQEEAPAAIVVTEEPQSVVVVQEEEPVVVAEVEQVIVQILDSGGGTTPHTHDQSDIVGLASALGAKAAQTALDAETTARSTADSLEAAARAAADLLASNRLDAIEADYATSDDIASRAPLSHTHTQDEVVGLLTALSGKATAAQGALADTAVQPADLTAALDGLIDAAPGTLDTLGEIAQFILDNDDILDALVLTVAGKASQADLEAEAALARNADNLTSGTIADARIPGTITRDSELTAAVAAEAALARDASNLTSGTIDDARLPSGIARDSEVTAAVAAEAALARNADNLTSGTVADARIASTIARDSEVTAAVANRVPYIEITGGGAVPGGTAAGTYILRY